MAQGQSCPATSFCMAFELKMIFIIFKQLKKKTREEYYFMTGKSYGIYLSVCINKVLLEHGHDIVGTDIAHDCFCVAAAELLGTDGLQSQRYVCLLALDRKSLLTPS